jgi:2-polyprenyl-3-methyl-5-hydroxy-6-metoxy-1,4-benzoquinol methylase
MSDWDDVADSWDEDEGARAYARAAFESLQGICLARWFSDRQLVSGRVLDFGCGTGLLTELLASRGAEVVAIDSSPRMLAVLEAKRERLGLSNVTTAGAVEPSLVPPAFDLVVCSSVCAFVDDYPETARELAALLRPGGLFVQWDWELDPSSDDPHGLSRAQIHEALTAAGLQEVVVETAFEVCVQGKPMRPLLGAGQRPR